jgi:membrane protease YdiL (CAAX protease family)
MRTAVVARHDPLSVVLAFALAALVARGVAVWSFLVPVLGATGVLAVQQRADDSASRWTWALVTGAGLAACATVRIALPGAPLHATAFGLSASVAAGVAEEIVFRRGLYGAVERSGPFIAIVVSALVFGAVHAPMYGWGVVPVDVGAGLVFGWQRWATGGWTSPAVAHAAANLLGAI